MLVTVDGVEVSAVSVPADRLIAVSRVAVVEPSPRAFRVRSSSLLLLFSRALRLPVLPA